LYFHQGIDKMKSAIQHIALNLSIKDLYADFTGADLDDGCGEQADDCYQKSYQAKGAAVTFKAIGSSGDDESADQQKKA
jgi:hypothetical protein